MKITKFNKALYEYLIFKVFTQYQDQVNDLDDSDSKKYKEWVYYADHLIKNLDGIYVKILENWLSFNELKSLDRWNMLEPKRELLQSYKYRCFEYCGRPGVYKFLNLSEQNEKAKTYVHYDYSSMKPKSFRDI
jgi:hypothetical protein